jgi:hypothetical protein
MNTSMLTDRFAAAADAAPLNDLAAGDRRELASLLAAISEFEELPGRWQAALLSAEAQDSSGQRPCCAKYSRAASSASRSRSPFAP